MSYLLSVSNKSYLALLTERTVPMTIVSTASKLVVVGGTHVPSELFIAMTTSNKTAFSIVEQIVDTTRSGLMVKTADRRMNYSTFIRSLIITIKRATPL